MYYNNLGCFYKEQGRLRNSLSALETAIDIDLRIEEINGVLNHETNKIERLTAESFLNNRPTRAETHLNACAVLSLLGRHEEALHHAYQAILLIQTSLMVDFMPGVGPDDIWPEVTNSTDGFADQRALKDRISVLTIAYHNLGSQQEFLNRDDDAIRSHKASWQMARRYLGGKDEITKKFYAVFRQA